MLITLDSHTKKFFDDTYHRAPAQEFVHLAAAGFEGRVFGIRSAFCPNGQRVLICQERSDSNPELAIGPVFVMEFPVFLGKKDILVEYSIGFTMSVMLEPEVQAAPDPLTSLHIIDGGVWRYHYDRESGWGCRVNSFGQCYVRNLRVRLDEEESFYLPASLGWKPFHSSAMPDWTRALLDMKPTTFHAKVRKETRSEGTPLHRCLSLYRKSEEEQCQTMLGLSVDERQRMEKLMRAYLAPELVEGGPLHGVSNWAWPMWNMDHFLVVQPDGSIQKWPVRAARLQEREEALASRELYVKPCNLEQELGNLGSSRQWPTEEMIRTFWLAKQTCSTEEMTGHEVTVEISLPWPDPTLSQGNKVDEA